MGKMERPESLKEWQAMFKSFFKEKNERDYESTFEILLCIVEWSAKTTEAIRKEKCQEITDSLPFIFCWILSFCNRVDVDLEKAVFAKYQDICPYCGAYKNCSCISVETKPSTWCTNPEGQMPRSIPEWQAMFGRIYGNVNSVRGLTKIWFHFGEEVGEVSNAFRFKFRKELCDELADCFAQFIGFCNKMEIDLAKITWETYPGVCSHCGSNPCVCEKV